MLTSKSVNAKKAKKLARHRIERSEYDAFVLSARVEYDDLVKKRERATSEKRLAELDEQITDHMHVSEVKALIKFHCEPVIARNVSFDKINAKGEAIRYGFICVLSKKGDTDIIPVPAPGPGQLMRLSNAKSMVTSGSLIEAYRACSRKLIAAEMARIEGERAKTVTQALRVAASVGDEADDMIDEAAALRDMMASFQTMDV